MDGCARCGRIGRIILPQAHQASLRGEKARSAMMDDIDREFTWWHQALLGTRGTIDADNPKAGFYRSKNKDKSLSAVAIWYDTNTGELRYQDNGRDVSDQIARERWPYVSKRPISEKVFW